MLVIQTFFGHDIGFHVERIKCLAFELSSGNVPVRLYHSAFCNYGYAWPLFYGDLFLVIPAVLTLWGIPPLVAYKLFVICCICACVLVSYYCGKKMFESRWAALCFVFTYAISSYYVVDMVQRAALGEVQSFIFIPLAFLGLHSILLKDGKYWYYLPIGLFCILMCHTLSMVMTVFLLLIYTLFFVTKLSWKKFSYIVGCAVVFLLLSASFTAPLLEQMSDAKFTSTAGGCISYYTMDFWAMSVRELFSLFNMPPYSQREWTPQGVGYLPLFLLLFRIVCLRKVKFCDGDKYFLAANVCLFVISTLFPWGNEKVVKYVSVIQFPWRFFTFSILFFACAAADYALRSTRNKIKIYTCVVCALGLLAFGRIYITTCYEYIGYNRSDYTVSYPPTIPDDLYLPAGTNYMDLMSRGEIVTTDGDDMSFSRMKNGGVSIQIDTTRRMGSYMDVPLIMYKGYTAVFNDEAGNGILLPIGYGENNVLRVHLGDVTTNGTIIVEYTGTIIQRVSFWISVMSFAVLIGVLLWRKKRKHSAVAVGDAATLP